MNSILKTYESFENHNNKSLPVSFYISTAICQQIMNVYINKGSFCFFFFKDICRCARCTHLPFLASFNFVLVCLRRAVRLV